MGEGEEQAQSCCVELQEAVPVQTGWEGRAVSGRPRDVGQRLFLGRRWQKEARGHQALDLAPPRRPLFTAPLEKKKWKPAAG